MKNLILVCLVLLIAGIVGFSLLPSSDAPPPLLPSTDSTSETEPAAQSNHKPTQQIVREEAKVNPKDKVAAIADNRDLTAQLELSGRVVDENGTPVANAEVGLFLRESMESVMRGGMDFRQMGRGGNAWSRFQFKRSGRTVKTDADGKFGIAAKAFPASTLDVAVTHRSFAPKVERLEWQLAEGGLAAKDIVLAPGGSVIGIVVDQDERPIPGAAVKYLSDGGRRGRGFGRRGSGSTLDQLLPNTKTDDEGRFELHGVPYGQFRILGEADRYLSTETGSLELKPEEELSELVLRLELGARITGIVHDNQGRAVAHAKVEGAMSNSVFSSLRGGNRGSSNRGGSNRGGSTRGGSTRGGETDWRALATKMQRQRQTVETNAMGQFDLDTLPHGQVKITVTHPRYIDEERDPIDTAETSQLEITVVRRLAIQGVVLDSATGNPLEFYGITARSISNNGRGMFSRGGRGGGRGGDRGSFNRGGQSDAERDTARMASIEKMRASDPERAERDLARLQRDQERRRERAQRAEARDSYNKNRLGASGRVPGKVPDPSTHSEGRFLIEDLQPGEYIFDIGAPGHVNIAAGPITLERGQKTEEVIFSIHPGTSLQGRVHLARNDEPIANADVELFLPAYNANSGTTQSGPRMPWDRGENLGTSLARTQTDPQGRFVLPPQLSGQYALRVISEGNRGWVERKLMLDAKRSITDLDIEIAVGSIVHGKVTDLEKGQAANVVFQLKDGERKTAKVDPATQGYEIAGLAGGDYYVTVELQTGSTDWRRRMGALARQQDSEPNLVLGENQELRYDLTVDNPDLGVVTGHVYLNNLAAEGYEVRLQRDAEASGDLPSTDDNGAGRMMDMMRRMRGATLRGSVNSEALFTIKDVPAGVYSLEVRASRRGRRGERGGRGGGDSALHREEIVVQVGGQVERRVNIFSGGLSLTFTVGKQGNAPSRARASMVLVDEGAGLEASKWRDQPSYQRLNLRAGKVELKDVKVGLYLISVEGTGFEPLNTEISVNAGDAVPQTLELKASVDKTQEKPGSEAQTNKK